VEGEQQEPVAAVVPASKGAVTLTAVPECKVTLVAGLKVMLMPERERKVMLMREHGSLRLGPHRRLHQQPAMLQPREMLMSRGPMPLPAPTTEDEQTTRRGRMQLARSTAPAATLPPETKPITG